MTPEQKAAILADLDARLSAPDARIVYLRPPHDVTERGDANRHFVEGQTTFIVIAIGRVHPNELDVRRLLSRPT